MAELKGNKMPDDLHSKSAVHNHQSTAKYMMTLMAVHGKVLVV